MQSALGVKLLKIDEGLPLISRERKLSELQKELAAVASRNLERYKNLIGEQERLCARLDEEPKRYKFEITPSNDLLKGIEKNIFDLQQKVVSLNS